MNFCPDTNASRTSSKTVVRANFIFSISSGENTHDFSEEDLPFDEAGSCSSSSISIEFIVFSAEGFKQCVAMFGEERALDFPLLINTVTKRRNGCCCSALPPLHSDAFSVLASPSLCPLSLPPSLSPHFRRKLEFLNFLIWYIF